MLRAGVLVLSVGLVALAGGAAYLALRSCAVHVPGVPGWVGRSCSDPAAREMAGRLDELRRARETLLADIRIAERRLAQMRCEAEIPPPPAPEPAAEPAPTAPEIDTDAWRGRDLGMLDGCWELDSDYRVRNSQTGKVTEYREWSMCFDAAGRGRTAMRASDGTTCQGTVSGRFDGGGRLVLEEPDDPECSDRTAILRRIITCSLTPDGAAACDSHQPSADLTAPVRLRRSAGAP